MAASTALAAFLLLAIGGLAPLASVPHDGGDAGLVPVPGTTPGSSPVPAPGSAPVRAPVPANVPAPTPSRDGSASYADLPPPEPALRPEHAAPWTPGSEMEALAYGLSQAPRGDDLRDLFLGYFHRSGFPVPAPPTMPAGPMSLLPPGPPSRPHFDPNDTLMFSHDLDDVDGDGFDDVAINAFCVTYGCQASTGGGGLTTFPPESPDQGASNCLTPQQVYAKSGRDGKLIWDIDLSRENRTLLDPENPLAFCPVHIVMGTIPVGPQSMDLQPGEFPPTGSTNGSALLVYSLGVFAPPAAYVVGNPFVLKLEHQIYALDGATGQRLWTHTEEGTVIMWDGCGVTLYRFCTPLGTGGLGALYGDRHNSKIVRADNLLVNPLLFAMAPGVEVRNAFAPSLMLQRVSFDYEVLAVWPGLPGSSRGFHVADDYRPREALARLDLNSGAVLWDQPSVTAETGKSIMPFLINAPTPGLPFTFFTGYQYEASEGDPWQFAFDAGYDLGVATLNYWRQPMCCGDISGDGIPDVVYSTHEWDPYQLRNEDGGFFLDARIIAFSGADGSRLWEDTIAEDVRRFAQHEHMNYDAFTINLELVGDADGDGTDDVMVHKFQMLEDLVHEAEIHSGADGSLIWGIRSPTHKITLPIGDADGDGGDDVAVFDWFDWDFPTRKQYDLANVTAHPIVIRSGMDGSEIWRAQTFNAPLDVYYILDGYKTTGLNDLDGDGVADFSIDDPTFLPDQTAVHQRSFLSGATGEELYLIRTVGTYSFPVWAGDTNMDGIDDLLVFSGEVADIWVTNHDGATGQPIWSQRFKTLNAYTYILAVPRVGVLALQTEGGDAPLVTFHLKMQTYGGFFFRSATYPQVTAYHDTGHRGWNFPMLANPELYQPVIGPTPAARLFEDALAEQEKTALRLMYDDNSRVIWKGVAPSLAAFLAMFFVSFKLTDALRRRRRAASEGGAEW